MLLDINRKELEKHIGEIIEKLEKSGLMPSLTHEKKGELVAQITNTLVNDKDIMLTKENIESAEGKKSLGLACMAACNPNNKFDYSQLFKDKLEFDDALKLALKDVFKNMLDLKYKNDPEKRKDMEKNLDNLFKVLEKNLTAENKQSLAKDVLSMQMLAKMNPESSEQKQLQEQRIMDYGVDTQNPGSVLKVVQAVVAGNQTGRKDNAPSGDNFMGKLNEPDADVPDPLGTKLAAVINSLADGVITSPSEREIIGAIKDAGMPTYKSPSLSMGGE